jgi:phosphoglucan,water dikinase
MLLLLLPQTPDGQYSGAFVSEFKIFVAELRDFFNAAGLTQLLEAVKGAMSSEDQQVGFRAQYKMGFWG